MNDLVWDSLMLRALLDLGNEHLLRPFDLELVRRSRVPGLVDEAQPAPRIAFFHPPKCGGTSVRKWLASGFGRPAGLDPLAAQAAAHNIGVAAASEREAILAYFVQRRDTCFICGHFAYSRRAFLDHENDFELITILRNPLSRILSRFYFRNGRHFPIEGALADWLETDDAKAAARVFTAMFVGDIEVAKHLAHAGKTEVAAAALQAIDNLKRFTIVGTLEQLGAFEEAIRRRYGIRARIGHARSNPTYPRFSEQPSTVQDRLRELCREDMMIYEAFAETPPHLAQ
ncbi:MAG TPA: hypothetical protein VJV39_18880 [Dongiaceae bacterium]|nr:hypothetical protein [Dongiaceae bacterium]